MNNKKVIMFSLFSFVIAIFGITLFFFNDNKLSSYADSLTSTYSVDFIAPDNSIIYSVNNISNGTTLEDLEDSNLLLNGDFNQNTTGQSIYYGNRVGVDYWRTLNSSSNIFDTTTNTVTFGVAYSSFLNTSISLNNYTGQTVTFSCYVNSFTGNRVCLYLYCPGSSSSTFRQYISLIGLNTFTLQIPSDWTNVSSQIGFQNTDSSNGATLSLSWVKFEVGSTATPYFNQSTLETKLSSYNHDNIVYSYDDTIYTSAITSNKYYYPVLTYNNYDNGYNDGYDVGYNEALNSFYLDNWSQIRFTTPNGTDFSGNLNGRYVWTDGFNYYYSCQNVHYIIDFSNMIIDNKIWNGLSSFNADYIWNDGSIIHYSYGSNHYFLNISTSTWISETWNGLSNFYGVFVWSDGVNTYLSSWDDQYVLNKSTRTWSLQTWSGMPYFYASYVWTDGVDYYFSYESSQYVLDVSTFTWSIKTWNGLTNFTSSYIWSDGVDIYYSVGLLQYVLNKDTSTWSIKIWSTCNNFYGFSIVHVGSSVFLLYDSYFKLDTLFTDSYNSGYSRGYDYGYSLGRNVGYSNGYNAGLENGSNYSFFGLISAVIDAPIKAFYGLFNFDLMGVNLAGFIQALLSLAVVIFIIRFALQR